MPDENHLGPIDEVSAQFELHVFQEEMFTFEKISQTVCAYVINFKEKKPRLLIDKCIQMGVPPG